MDINELIRMLQANAAPVDPTVSDPNSVSGVYGMDPFYAGGAVNWGAVPGAEDFYAYDGNNNQERADPRAIAEFLRANNMQWMQGNDPASETYGNWLQGPDGPIVESGRFGSSNEDRFRLAAAAAAAVTGANVLGAGGAFGAQPVNATGAAGGASGGVGTLGTIAPGAGQVAALPTVGSMGLGPVSGGAMAGSLIPGISNGQLLNIGGGLLNGLIGSNAAGKAADAQLQGGQEANALMREMWQASQDENKPLLDLRNAMLPQIQGLASDPSSITQDPSYAFQLGEGQRALERGAAARGMTYSGPQAKALQRYGQDYAGTKLDQTLNRYMGVAGLGQVGSTNNQAANAGYGGQMANNLADMGNVRGSSYMGQAGAWGGAVNNALNGWQDEQWRNLYRGG